eukprot:4573891-Pyramimonas_sp.AAC.1
MPKGIVWAYWICFARGQRCLFKPPPLKVACAPEGLARKAGGGEHPGARSDRAKLSANSFHGWPE